MKNIYLPEQVKITKIKKLSGDVKLFRLEKKKGKFPTKDGLVFRPGQFVLAGVWGYGEDDEAARKRWAFGRSP